MLEFHANAVTEKQMVPFLGWTGCTSSCCYAYDCTWVHAWCGSCNTSFRCAHFRVLEQDPWPNDHTEKCQRRRTPRAETPFTPLTPCFIQKVPDPLPVTPSSQFAHTLRSRNPSKGKRRFPHKNNVINGDQVSSIRFYFITWLDDRTQNMPTI